MQKAPPDERYSLAPISTRNMRFMNRSSGLTVLIVTIALFASPAIAQQNRTQAPKKPLVAPVAEPAPTFDSLLGAESYRIYSEVRNIGQLVRSSSLNEVLEPVMKLASPPKEFRTVLNWVNAHADALAGSRMLVTGWPSDQALPSVLMAIEFSSVDEARKFESELRGFVPKLLPKPTPPASSPGMETPIVTPSSTPQTERPASPYQIKQSGSLVLLSDKLVSFPALRPRGSRLLAEDQNFATARGRFASESVFIYVDFKSIEKEERKQREKFEEEAKRRREAEIANAQAASPPIVEAPSPIVEADGPPMPVIVDRDVTPPAPGQPEIPQGEVEVVSPGTDTFTVSGTPSESEEVDFPMFSLYSMLLGGPSKWPEAIGAAIAIEGDGYMVRALIINATENKSVAVPFMPQVVSGPALTPASPNVMPADSNFFVSLSLDYSQMYEGILKNFAALEEASNRSQLVAFNPAASPFAAYEKKLGLKIKEDLLPLLGNEIALALPKTPKPETLNVTTDAKGESAPQKAASAQVHPLIAISVKDREAVRKLIPKLVEAMAFKGADFLAQTEKQDDTEIVSYANVFSYAFVGDFLIFSPDPTMTRHAVSSYLSNQTLSSDGNFRNSTRWQPRQLQGQVFIAPGMIDLYLLGTNPSSAASDKTRELMAGLGAVIEPMTYALSNEGSGPLHELHIPRNLLLYTIGAIASEASQSSLVTNESIARSVLRTVSSAEATFQTTKGDGRYGTLDDLISEGLLSKELAHQYGYKIEVAAVSNKFEATAVPLEYGKTGRLSFFIDETGVLRGGDHGGGAATVADKPVE